jgi:hypothetical protein
MKDPGHVSVSDGFFMQSFKGSGACHQFIMAQENVLEELGHVAI